MDTGIRQLERKRWFAPALGLIGVVAWLIPAYYTLTVRSHDRFWGDPRFFYYWPATQVAQGRGFLNVMTVQYGQPVPSASHPPGFVALLAGFYRLGLQSPQAMRYALCVMTAATVVIIGVLVGRLANERAGLIAAIIAAVYPNIWISSTLLMSETLLLFGLALGLLGFYGFTQQAPRLSRLVVCAVGFTLAASARPEILVLFPVVIVPLVLSRRRALAPRTRLGFLVVAAVIPLCVFGPWYAYNASRFERPVLVSTGFGQTLLTGACDDVFHGPMIGYWSVACTAQSFPPKPEPGAVPDESLLDEYFRKRALRYYSYHKRQVPLVVLARMGRMFGVYHPADQNTIDSYVDHRGSFQLVRASQIAFWVLCLIGVAGFVQWRRRKIPVYPFVAIFALVVVVEAITFGNTRYRVAIDLCLVLLAATVIDRMIALGAGRVRRPEARAADVAPFGGGPSGQEAPNG